MKTKIFLPTIVLTGIFLLTSCCKKDDSGTSGAPTQPLVFISLVAASDTLTLDPNGVIQATTQIVATTTGDNLTYNWSLETQTGSVGDILGSGATVTYGASFCCTGNNTIICTITNGLTTESKSVLIVVKEP